LRITARILRTWPFTRRRMLWWPSPVGPGSSGESRFTTWAYECVIFEVPASSRLAWRAIALPVWRASARICSTSALSRSFCWRSCRYASAEPSSSTSSLTSQSRSCGGAMCFRSRPRLAPPVQVWRRRHRLHQRRPRRSVAERAGHQRPEPRRPRAPQVGACQRDGHRGGHQTTAAGRRPQAIARRSLQVAVRTRRARRNVPAPGGTYG
jgi:hypothetical protein